MHPPPPLRPKAYTAKHNYGTLYPERLPFQAKTFFSLVMIGRFGPPFARTGVPFARAQLRSQRASFASHSATQSV